ncbi:hypothetical protein ABEG17_17335 [Pedococcus sp. KACC 23699]|uniref:MOSC domain-containing protein n=1 Tax=Pedococcus sp. KACC 23699 TaxID=3149228 RepID=A0AAU7JSV1_9MICO
MTDGETSATVLGLHIHPVKGAPGRDLQDALVDEEGLRGDRRKKAPVQVIAAEDVADDTRANVVVTLTSQDLAATVGAVLRLGEVELAVTGPAGSCPGVYAGVRRGGTLHLGDAVSVVGEPA